MRSILICIHSGRQQPSAGDKAAPLDGRKGQKAVLMLYISRGMRRKRGGTSTDLAFNSMN